MEHESCRLAMLRLRISGKHRSEMKNITRAFRSTVQGNEQDWHQGQHYSTYFPVILNRPTTVVCMYRLY